MLFLCLFYIILHAFVIITIEDVSNYKSIIITKFMLLHPRTKVTDPTQKPCCCKHHFISLFLLNKPFPHKDGKEKGQLSQFNCSVLIATTNPVVPKGLYGCISMVTFTLILKPTPSCYNHLGCVNILMQTKNVGSILATITA